MWESPSWVGTLISGKINERVAAADRVSKEAIADADRASREAIASESRANDMAINEASNEVKRYVAEVDAKTRQLQIDADREIAQMRIDAEAEIAKAKRESDEAIAKANRENALEVAKVQALGNVSSTVIRTMPTIVPLVIGKNGSDSKSNGNSGGTINASGGAVLVERKAREVSPAQKRADDLFPELDPTFKVNKSKPSVSSDPLPTLPKSTASQWATLLGAGALLTAASSAINFMPIVF